MQIQFGQVYKIRSYQLDARKRAEKLAEEKKAQGIDAVADQSGVVFPEEEGMHAFVYTNENDDPALNYSRIISEQRNEQMKALLKKYSPESYSEDLTIKEIDARLADAIETFDLETLRAYTKEMCNRSPEGARASSNLLNSINNAEVLYFDKDGNQVDYIKGIWSD